MDFLSAICILTIERSIKNDAKLKMNLPLFDMYIFFAFVDLKFERIHLPVSEIDSKHPRSPEIWVFNQTESHIFLQNTIKFGYDGLIITSKNPFWLLVEIASLHEDSVSACRVLHCWEQHDDAVHAGDEDIREARWNEYLEAQDAIQVTFWTSLKCSPVVINIIKCEQRERWNHRVQYPQFTLETLAQRSYSRSLIQCHSTSLVKKKSVSLLLVQRTFSTSPYLFSFNVIEQIRVFPNMSVEKLMDFPYSFRRQPKDEW